MAKKTFTYRGKTLEELQKLSLNELAVLLPARQRRKIKRGFSDSEKKLVEDLKKSNNVKTHLRDMIVLPSMVGKMVRIHTGKEFHTINLEAEMVGFYLGELAITRRRVTHNSPGVGATKSSGNVSVR